MKKCIYFVLLLTFTSTTQAGEPRTFITQGVGSLISADGIFTYGRKEKDVAIPEYINVGTNPKWEALTYDSKSGWTKCRLPLAGGKSLVFNCKAIR